MSLGVAQDASCVGLDTQVAPEEHANKNIRHKSRVGLLGARADYDVTPPLGYVQWQRATVCPRGVAWPMVRGYRRPLHSDRVNERQSYTRIIRLASRITGERRDAKTLKKGDTV